VIQQGTERIPWVVGITGASGTPYAAAVLRGLLDAGLPVDPVVSQAARLTLIDETGSTFHEAQWREDTEQFLGRDVGNMLVWKVSDYFTADPASGSYLTRGMIIVPASTAVIAGVATGISRDLIQPAADVTLEERRLPGNRAQRDTHASQHATANGRPGRRTSRDPASLPRLLRWLQRRQ
jgi:4-hydroxy-3-polyprenylbenzoate decarboxylase